MHLIEKKQIVVCAKNFLKVATFTGFVNLGKALTSQEVIRRVKVVGCNHISKAKLSFVQVLKLVVEESTFFSAA